MRVVSGRAWAGKAALGPASGEVNIGRVVEGEGKRLAANPRRAELLDLMLLLMLLLLLLVLLVGLCVLCWWRLGGRMEGYAVLALFIADEKNLRSRRCATDTTDTAQPFTHAQAHRQAECVYPQRELLLIA